MLNAITRMETYRRRGIYKRVAADAAKATGRDRPGAVGIYGYTRSGQPQEAGRLVSRQRVQPGFRSQAWHYRWDSRNQLRQLETPDGKRWEYRYDSVGRRISKRHGDEEVRFLWDGDQPAEIRYYRNGECVSRLIKPPVLKPYLMF